MDETIRLNTLDYQTYEDLQQKMIDVLDTCEYARIIWDKRKQDRFESYVN